MEWQKADNTFLISGSFQADFKIFKTYVQLGNTPQTGLVVQNGTFSLHDVKFTLSDANFGAFTIKLLTVQWDETGVAQVPYTLTVKGDVVLPGGLEAKGGFRIVNGNLNEIDLTISSATGVPIPGTGVFVTQLGGSIENLDDPAHLIVQAHMALIYGEKFSFAGYDVNLFRVEGDITADASELVLGGTILVGAYTNDNGTTWKGAVGQGDAKLTLDWAEQIYDLHLDVDGLFGIFDISGDLTFEPGKEIDFLATANVVVPPEIPFIGGDTLGGLGFFFQHVFPHDDIQSSTTVAAWIDIKVIWDIEVGVQVYVDAGGTATVSIIGKDQIDNFGKEVQHPADQSYTYSVDLSNLVPAVSTYLTYSADWSQPAPGTTIVSQPTFTVLHTVNGTTTPIPEADFAANGIQLITDPTLTTATSQALQIVGSTSDSYTPLVGSYQVQVTFTAQGGAPFPHFAQQTSATIADYPDQLKIDVTHSIPLPSFGPLAAAAPFVPAVPATPNAVFPVQLAGNMDEGLIPGAMVNVYLVRVNDPLQLAINVASVTPTTATGGGVNWQATANVPINGLYPLEYKLYATVDDSVNAPAKSMVSTNFTPAFAVEGSVANQNHDSITGWTLYLDYNRDGQREPNEPSAITSSPDGFYAFTPTFAPFDRLGPGADRPEDRRPVDRAFRGLRSQGKPDHCHLRWQDHGAGELRRPGEVGDHRLGVRGSRQ